MNDWHSKTVQWRREANEKYNFEFMSRLGLVDNYEFENYKNENYYIAEGFNKFQIVWLKNIDMMMASLPFDFDISDYTLYDLGCGTGISTIYFYWYYGFNKFIGIDIEEMLISKAKINLNKVRFTEKKCEIEFKVDNILSFVFSNKDKPFIYLYNSLSLNFFLEFLQKNLDFFKKNKAVLLFNSDQYYKQYSSFVYGSIIIRNELYSQTIILF
jgi:SAM-dependent methyltransferase